jgi:hypothetical protein
MVLTKSAGRIRDKMIVPQKPEIPEILSAFVACCHQQRKMDIGLAFKNPETAEIPSAFVA